MRPLIRPVELSAGRPWTLADGTVTQTDDVFAMFSAAREGDIETVQRLVARAPSLATVEYYYTPPIHFAVREGHREVAAFLLEHGADPAYRSYPFQESLLTFAQDRGHEVAREWRGSVGGRGVMVHAAGVGGTRGPHPHRGYPAAHSDGRAATRDTVIVCCTGAKRGLDLIPRGSAHRRLFTLRSTPLRRHVRNGGRDFRYRHVIACRACRAQTVGW